MHLFPAELHDEIASLVGPAQHIHLLPNVQEWGPNVLRVHAPHHPPLGKPNLIVAHDSVIPRVVGGFSVLEVCFAAVRVASNNNDKIITLH